MSDELQSVEIGFRKEGHFVPAPPTAKDFFAACALLEDENARLTAEIERLRECATLEAKVARLQAVIDRLVEAGAPMVRWVDPELFGPFRSAISAARGEQDA